MKIFLTGGTGFIGSHFIDQAHLAGHSILALRRSKKSKPRVALKKDPVWLDKLMEDVTIEDLEGCDVVVHLAAHSANVPYDSIENCIVQNVVDPLTLFGKAKKAGIDFFIAAGSCFEYGKSGERYKNIPVDAPLEPTTSYPASKAAASVAFHAFCYENAVKLLVLRIFQVYGKGELETRFWPSLKKAAETGEDFKMTSGLQIRDFVNVEDVASAFVTSLEREDLEFGLPKYENLGSGNPQSLAQFAKSQWVELGATGHLLLGEVPQRRNDVMRFVPEV